MSNIVYNLAQYLINNFSGYNFVVNGFNADGPVEQVNIIETGGSTEAPLEVTRLRIQILVRGANDYQAREQAQAIFRFLSRSGHGRWCCELPATSLTGSLLPAVTISEINALQLPDWIGRDSNGLGLVSSNYQLIYAQ